MGAGRIREIYVSSFQLCCEPKTILKKSLKKRDNTQQGNLAWCNSVSIKNLLSVFLCLFLQHTSSIPFAHILPGFSLCPFHTGGAPLGLTLEPASSPSPFTQGHGAIHISALPFSSRIQGSENQHLPCAREGAGVLSGVSPHGPQVPELEEGRYW